MLLLSMFVRPKMGYVRGKIGLTGQFDLRQPGNYLQPCYGMMMMCVYVCVCVYCLVIFSVTLPEQGEVNLLV